MDEIRVTDDDAGGTRVGTVVTTDVNRFWLDRDGVVHIEALPGRQQTRADAEHTLAVSWEVGGRQRRLTLVDLRQVKGLDRGARTSYGNSTAALAVAMVIGSPLTRVIGNVFIGFGKPVFPVRLFTSECEGLAWLRTLVG